MGFTQADLFAQDNAAFAYATVTLIAWPNQDVLDGLGDGDAVDTKIVSQATTDARGRFAASLNPAVVGSDHTGADGEVDIQLAASHSDKEIVWSFTATRAEEVNSEANAWASSLAEDPVTSVQLANQVLGPTHLAIDIGDPSTVVEKGHEPWTWIGPDGEPLGVGAEATAAVQVDSHPASIGVAAAALSATPGLSTAAAGASAASACSWITGFRRASGLRGSRSVSLGHELWVTCREHVLSRTAFPQVNLGAPGSVQAQDIPDACLATCRTDVAGHSGLRADARACRRSPRSSGSKW
jgi:hypothetical protein